MPKYIPAPPFAKNGLASDFLFFQRRYYARFPQIYPNGQKIPRPIDIWNDKIHFGKVDTAGYFAFPNPGALKKISRDKDLQTINFVADAYFDFVRFVLAASERFKTCMTSIIDVTSPTKAYTDVVQSYYNYFTNTLDQNFINLFTTPLQKAQITSFVDYIDQYITYVDMNPSLSHTLSSYLASNAVSNRCSGLIIEFAKPGDSYDDDGNKWRRYLSSDFFDDYTKIAGKFGFYIDKNIPWRIVANMNSKGMKGYMSKYAIANATGNFLTNFLQAEYFSYISFKKYMFASYQTFLDNEPRIESWIIKNCIKKSTIGSVYTTKRIISERPTEFLLSSDPQGEEILSVSYKNFLNIYPESFFIEKYIQIRFLESGYRLTDVRMKKFVKEILYKHKKSKDLYETITFLQRQFYRFGAAKEINDAIKRITS